MTGHEIDALLRLAFFALIDIRASAQPKGHGPGDAIVPFEEGPDVVAKFPVPLVPAVADKRSDLVETAGIPGFRDQFHVGEDRIRLDLPEDRRRCYRAAAFVARQYRGQIEAEAVDMHLAYPMTEAVEDETPDNGFIGVERVAAAGEVGVARPVGGEHVIRFVGKPAEA